MFYDCSTGETNLPEPVCVLDLNVGEGISVTDFKQQISFRKIGKREVAHFGPDEYRYSGFVHPPCDYPTFPAMNTVISRMNDFLPDSAGFDKEQWSCLVTLYESGESFIPPHSDNEDTIVPDSEIYTVSIGATRKVVFQNIVGPLQNQQEVELVHGSVHRMSQSSQTSWEHSVPPSENPTCGPRLSLTFRRLRKTDRPIIPPIAPPNPNQNLNNPPVRPKRILLLADSIHASFPTHLFDPMSAVCIKKHLPNYCLSDINIFESEFAYTDYVFISCGINDLSRYGHNAHNMSQNFRDLMCEYQFKYPKTQFIFNSVLLTKYDWLNHEVSILNNEIFHFTCRPNSNVWFFDAHHVARVMSVKGEHILETNSRRANGIHLTYRATNEIRRVIISCFEELCINRSVNIKKLWPLRPDYRRIAENQKF